VRGRGLISLLVLVFGISFLVAACGGSSGGESAVPDGAPKEASPFADEWPAPNGDYGNTRVAAGSEISSDNVADLGIAWAKRITATGTFGGYASTPLIVDGVVYTQDLESDVRAYDLQSGDLKWQHAFDSPNVGPNGLTIGDGRIYGATSEQAFALDADSGDQIWLSEKLVRNDREGIDMAPAVFDGMVYVSTVPGNAKSFYAGNGQGVLWALDAETGKKQWTFDTVPPDLWNEKLKEINSGGGLWHPPAFDGDAMYIDIANPAPWPGTNEHPWGASRPGPNLYTNSTVRLDPETGKMAWHRQVLPHDVYDWDLHLPPIVGTANGTDVVFVSGKLGRVYAIDRSDGSVVWEQSVGRHNGHDDDNKAALAGETESLPKLPLTVYPGILGGVETLMALDAGRLFVPIVNLPAQFDTQEKYKPVIAKGTGEFLALDADTGQTDWKVDLPTPAYGAATVSNDLVFTTTFAGHLMAFDVETGKTVLDRQLPAGTNATVAISGDTLVTAASFPQGGDQVAQVIAYRLGANGSAVSGGGGTTGGGGGQGGGGQAAGKSVFTSNCGSCHTLADAGSGGSVGPNLDELQPSRDQVEQQVRNGGGGMPAFQGRLSDDEIGAVSNYVAKVAGKTSGGGGGGPGGGP
jgi:outer membrane protein assembly factor BamB